jgi:hypothetical protein
MADHQVVAGLMGLARLIHWDRWDCETRAAALESALRADLADARRMAPEAVALRRIVDAYDAYRGKGVAPAPNQYFNLVSAIDAGRALIEPRQESQPKEKR